MTKAVLNLLKFLDMRTIQISLSVSQELILLSSIRREIFRKHAIMDSYRLEGIDVSSIHDDILELKTLYRKITGHNFII